MSLTNIDLVMMPTSELKELAKSYHIKTDGKSHEQVLEAVQLAAIRKEDDLRQKVVEARRAEALLQIGMEVSGKKRPSPENLAILASPKVRVKFLNREDSGGTDEMGADVTFIKGTFRFHLWDGKEHILPACLVAEDDNELPEVTEKVTNFYAALGMNKAKASQVALGVMQRLSLPISCQYPVYADVKKPTGETVSEVVGWRRRFEFIPSKNPVPKNAEFGVIESEVKHAKARSA